MAGYDYSNAEPQYAPQNSGTGYGDPDSVVVDQGGQTADSPDTVAIPGGMGARN